MNARTAVDVLVLIIVIAAPVIAFVRTRSLTWTFISLTASIAIIGSVVSFGIELGHRWTYTELQGALMAACGVVVVAAFLSARRAPGALRHQALAVLLPALVILAFIVASRVIARPLAGGLTAVGFFIDRVAGEDNAKWLDFAGQVVTGAPVDQGIALGGALQLVMVSVATLLSVASALLLGGVNEVFVAANTVVYSQHLLVVLSPLALAPVAEALFRDRSSPEPRSRARLAAPAIWAGALVIATANAALMNFGHFTLQWVILVVTLWFGVFLVPTGMRHAVLLTSVTVAVSATVWFPMTPVSIVIVLALGIWIIGQGIGGRSLARVDWFGLAVLALVVVTMARSTRQTLLYLTDQPLALGAAGGSGGAVSTGLRIPALQLLESRGGTESVAPILAILAAVSVVVAGMFLARQRPGESAQRRVLRFAPILLLTAYAIALGTLGTWWAGTGPEYGALKTTFMVTIAALGVTLPLAIGWLAGPAGRMSSVRWLAVGCVVYLLAVDSILPRAMSMLSPQRWPQAVGVTTDYWWPAEVRPVAEQPIADSPIACVYLPAGGDGPTALPNGQTSYSCTRILAGLSGADASAQALVDWSRREWLTNEKAWTAVWPDLVTLPASIRSKRMILLDDVNQVIGMETVNAMLDRYRPEWAKGKPLSEFTG